MESEAEGLIQDINSNMILLSFTLAYLASYVGISLCEQMRSSFLHGEKDNWLIRGKWLLMIGMTLGGAGMWCLHFVGMTAMTLRVADNPEIISVGYNLGLTIGSLIVVIFCMSLGIAIASNDHLFAKSKSEIIEAFILSTNKYSMAEVRRTKDSKIIYIICTQELGHLLLGGFIAGSGVIGMHYMGVEAMEYDEYILKSWRPGTVAASCLIAIIGSTLAFWILFRLLSIFPSREYLRLFSAGILALSFGASHYVGMEALVLKHIHGIEKSTLSQFHIDGLDVIPIVLACFVVLWTFVIYAFADTRRLLYKYRHFIQLTQRKAKGGNNGPSGTIGKSTIDHLNDMFAHHSHNNGKLSSMGGHSANESYFQRLNKSLNSSNNQDSKASQLGPIPSLHDTEKSHNEKMHKPPTPNASNLHRNPNHSHVKFIEMIKSSSSVVPMDGDDDVNELGSHLTDHNNHIMHADEMNDYHDNIEDYMSNQTSVQHSFMTDQTPQTAFSYQTKISTIPLQPVNDDQPEDSSKKNCLNASSEDYAV